MAARYSSFALCVLGLVLCFLAAVAWPTHLMPWVLAAVFLGLTATGVHDLRQARHAILRNYPVIGHLRFLLEYIRPEMRQYFIESDTEAAPFSRAQRSLVYQRAKGEPDNRPFGTQLDVTIAGYEWINHSMQPTRLADHDFRIVIGARLHAALQRQRLQHLGDELRLAVGQRDPGAEQGREARAASRTTPARARSRQHHRVHGGDLIWEIGSGYFGCRNDDGSFSEERFVANARDPQVKMIELKLSQGAKPGHGGVLPGAQGHGRDRGGARRAGGRGLHLAVVAQRVLDAGRR